MRSKPFQILTYRQHYGEAQPPDVAGYYGLLDCPVDICAGRADGVIAKENVRYASGPAASTTRVQEAAALRCLQLPAEPPKPLPDTLLSPFPDAQLTSNIA
jgi:hypothetical protein